MKVVVFDLGGTLMNFEGMPPVWIDYYRKGFEKVNSKFNLNLDDEKIEDAVNILKNYNPRINYRENEISPTDIFLSVIKLWDVKMNVDVLIKAFFEAIELKPIKFDYSVNLINDFKNRGFKTACLTDLPSGMPDDMFKKSIMPLINTFDLYVSSQSCGYRKPNPYGLNYIADYFNTEISEILFIGDEVKDELTAHNAGCNFKYIDELKKEMQIYV